MSHRNFLITYSGRVGSTALIDTLKLISPIIVPIFEELDYWSVEANHQLDVITEATVHEQVDAIYREDRNGLPATAFAIGFKWRLWGNMSAVARVLRDHDVLVLNMTRADIAEFIGSLYLTDLVYGEFNAPQFVLRDTTDPAERERIMFRYRMTQVAVDLDRYHDLAQTRIEEERARVNLLQQLRAEGVTVQTILYEDFAYKRFHFLSGFLSALRLPAPQTIPLTKLAKVSTAFPTELFSNRAELFADKRLLDVLRAWESLVYHSGNPLLLLETVS